MAVAATTYTIFIKKAFIITLKDVISIIDSNSQMIDETFIFVISTEISVISTKVFVISTKISVISTKSVLSTSIDFLLKRILLNDITVYDIKTMISQLIIAMYDYSDI